MVLRKLSFIMDQYCPESKMTKERLWKFFLGKYMQDFRPRYRIKDKQMDSHDFHLRPSSLLSKECLKYVLDNGQNPNWYSYKI
jgi:hypothetical protein